MSALHVIETACGGWAIKPVPGQTFADVYPSGDSDAAYRLALAMAAAPELLEAAERIERIYGMAVPAFDALRAAIAKARGQ